MKNITTLDKLDFRGQKVLITGVGRYRLGSNNSAARFFAARGAKVTITDSKAKKELAAGLKHLRGVKATFHLGGYRRADFLAADLIMKNQGNRALEPYLAIARRAGKRITTDVGLFLKLAPQTPIVGVTGTRGKSTTTAILGEMFRADGVYGFMGGNLKVSPLNFLDELRGHVRRGRSCSVVLELSSWLLEGWTAEGLAPHIAVITNIFPDHLNTYASYADYIFAKSEIFRAQGADDFVVLNRENAETRRLAALAEGQVFWFASKPFAGKGAFVKGGKIFFRYARTEQVARLSDIRHLKGAHNLENILAAVAAAKLSGVLNGAIVRTLRTFRGLPDRQEPIRTVKGACYVNDTTATSPDGAVAAIRTLAGTGKRRLVLIAGGTDKKLDFKEMARMIKKRAKALVMFDGTATVAILKELKKIGYAVEAVPIVKDMATAVGLAGGYAGRGDIVLLSPGAASFGIFKNEFDRGAQFVKAVKALK